MIIDPKRRDVALVVDDSPETLRLLFAGIPSADPELKSYLDEALTCARNDCFRAAVIMGWCAAAYRIHRKLLGLGLTQLQADLDKMLLPSQTKTDKKPVDPKTFAGLSGHASVKIDKLTMKKQTVTDIVADVTVNEDDIKVNTAQLKAFGGTVTASGTAAMISKPSSVLPARARPRLSAGTATSRT